MGLLLLLESSTGSLRAQNVIGGANGDASAILELQSSSQGLLIPRMTSTERSAIANPAASLMIYNTTLGCVEINIGSSSSPDWLCLAGAGKVASLDCSGAVQTGSLVTGTAASGVSVALSYTGGNGNNYGEQTVTSTGVTGLTAMLSAGAFSGSSGSLTYTISGTPSAEGTASFALVVGGQSCTLNLTVNPPVGTIGSLNCGGATTTGALTSGIAASGMSTSVPYTGGNGGTHNGQTVTSTGITGLTATLPAGTFVSGSSNLSYAITGTPSGAGTASFALSIGGQSCTLSLTVATNPGSLPAGSGSFAGLSCFDIALSNDDTNNCAPLSGRLAQQADFTDAATHTQVYTFTPTGTVSNVRFAYINTNGSVVAGLSGGNSGNNITTAVTATVNYNTNLNTLALGLTNSNPLRAEIYVIYNDGASNNGTDRQLKLTARVKDCACCGAFLATSVWRQFMCHNLGANESADPFTPSWELNGHYYQWGRNPTCFGRDGTDDTNPCSSPVYGAAAPWGNTTANDNAGTITGWNTTAAANGAWADGSKTVNDPCPAGWRVPTATQLTGLANNTQNSRTLVGSWTNNSTNYSVGYRFGQSLFLPAAGFRGDSNGSLLNRGFSGTYWSSTENSSRSRILLFTSIVASVGTEFRTFGFSVRCVAE